MQIGLIDVDSNNFPNLALMKISAYHKAAGHSVEWWYGIKPYDIVYQSKVFDNTYSKDIDSAVWAGQVVRGGIGYGLDNRLPAEIETMYPEAYGFLTRGCPNNYSFCIVGRKEGYCSKPVASLDMFWRGQAKIKLLDPNILACKEREQLLQQLVASRALVDFTQGLDARLLDRDVIALLKTVRTKYIHLAWDRERDSTLILDKLRLLLDCGVPAWKLKIYVLVNYDTPFAFDLHRVYTLRRMGVDPYIMIYNKPGAPREIRLLQRWVNNRRLWQCCERFEDYNEKIG